MSEKLPPIIFRWDGEAMVPLDRFHNVANATFTVGEIYRLEPIEERSLISHRHYFACIHEAWLTLPDPMASLLPTSEHLRKFALIKTGYRDERSIQCASKAEALRLAAFIKPMDEFAIIVPTGALVTVYTAKSQSMKAMGKRMFQESKDAVLAYLADTLGVTPAQLNKSEAA